MDNKIYANTSLVDLNQLRVYDCYFREENIFMRAYQDCIVITDITNALIRGLSCPTFRFHFANGNRDRSLVCEFFNTLDDHNFSLAQFINILRSGESLSWLEDRFNILHAEEPALRVYSPFAHVAPLKKRPKKWTIPHIWKVLLAGQVKQAECTGYYTDDYASDAAYNYRQGVICPVTLAQKIIKSPSGWRAYIESETEDEIRLNVSCYHFDNNLIIIDASNMD